MYIAGLSVVNVQALNYPNNVKRVAEYESNGEIKVELSEDVRDNQVYELLFSYF